MFRETLRNCCFWRKEGSSYCVAVPYLWVLASSWVLSDLVPSYFRYDRNHSLVDVWTVGQPLVLQEQRRIRKFMHRQKTPIFPMPNPKIPTVVLLSRCLCYGENLTVNNFRGSHGFCTLANIFSYSTILRLLFLKRGMLFKMKIWI